MGWMEKKGTPLPPSVASSRIFGSNPQLGERAKRHLPPFQFPPFPLSLSPVPFSVALPHSLATRMRAQPHDARHHGQLIPAFFAFFLLSDCGERTSGETASRKDRPPRNELSPSVVVRLEDVAEGPVSGVVRASPSQGASCPLFKRLFRQNCPFQIL